LLVESNAEIVINAEIAIAAAESNAMFSGMAVNDTMHSAEITA
jgi:hypothetical protein